MDTLQREQATDPTDSFIVQAPAGSGKTEILTQRYLRLLGTVEFPEQIIALTFTRKAACEMRERILTALSNAEQAPTSTHMAKTYAYAKIALARDKELNWGILTSPSRLRIMTIDALCQRLLQALPLQNQHGFAASITANPQKYYMTAARNCLHDALDSPIISTHIQNLLSHLDNRQDRLFELFSQLLAARDQWLPLLYQANNHSKASFEAALANMEAHELARFKDTIPQHLADELLELARIVANLETNIDSPRSVLRNLYSLDELTGEHARGLCALLLTSLQTLRKSFDHHVGVRRNACSDSIYYLLKAQSKELMAELATMPDFLQALLRIQYLPQPQYDSKQWQVLQALFLLLPQLIAQLWYVFKQNNCLDFIEVAQSARLALGSEDDVTDLALYLDHKLKHLLIDEFQDTSIQQFQFITQLVAGFEVNDGRTIFVVGDPMQSIYRFRAAEVGLFLRAQQYGIGYVRLTPLSLSQNFRATSTVISWINAQFATIFPQSNDMTAGAIAYSPATATKITTDYTAISAISCETQAAQALNIVQTIADYLINNPTENIALLVRSRLQLKPIIAQLHHAGIAFQGVDIDLLTDLPHVHDTWILTEALLMPANRLAWLCLLRSPWCGLSIEDIHHLATQDPSLTIYETIIDRKYIAELSADGQERLNFIAPILHNAITHRAETSLVTWILQTQRQLHCDLHLTQDERVDLEQYWQLLDEFDTGGLLVDLQLFKQEFNRLYAKQTTTARLQIMTIHKSKGLEFDCVILPGLSSAVSDRSQPLLRWLQLPTADKLLLLCSPIKAAEDEYDELYRYLAKIDDEKQQYEIQRLLYVAITRAKKQLFLFDYGTSIRKGSFRALLEIPFTQATTHTKTIAPTYNTWRLPTEVYMTSPNITEPPNQKLNFNTAPTIPRILGIVTHELLQWICTHHPQSLEEVPIHLANYKLKLFGINTNFTTNITELLRPLFTTERGQWIIQKHENEQNEYALQVQYGGRIVTRILDRMFYDNGTCWIIDFKTGSDDANQQSQHALQLLEYAKLIRLMITLPIRCGVYYLAQANWLEVTNLD